MTLFCLFLTVLVQFLLTAGAPKIHGDASGKMRILPRGMCHEERARKLKIISQGEMADVVAPSCTEQGYWKVEQFDGDGRRRCVNPINGKFIAGNDDDDGKLTCGACHKRLEDILRKPLPPRTVIPRCDEEGWFLPKQSDSAGYSYCVNRLTGEKTSNPQREWEKGTLNCLEN